MELVALSSLCACLLALLLAVRVVSRPSDNPPAAWSLALYLVSVSAFVADQIAYTQDWFARFPHAFAVANPFIVAIFPSLYLYVRGVTHPTARWSRRSLTHFGLPVVAMLIDLPTYLLSAEQKTAAARAQITRGQASPDEMIYLLILNLYALSYLALTWRSVHAGRARLSESAEEGRAQSFRGLESFVALLTTLTTISAVLDFTPWRFPGSLAVALAAVVGVFTAFWLLADHEPLLKTPARETPSLPPQPALTETQSTVPTPVAAPTAVSVPAQPLAPTDGTANTTTAPSPTLRPVEVERLQRRLENLLAQEKIYLDADLSLQGLADRAETTRHKMSAAIREIYGLTFYQLVARHRVQEAARRLRSKAGACRTISDIAFSVGFNTLSAFNTAFKAEFGVTPSKFRESSTPPSENQPTTKSSEISTLAK